LGEAIKTKVNFKERSKRLSDRPQTSVFVLNKEKKIKAKGWPWLGNYVNHCHEFYYFFFLSLHKTKVLVLDIIDRLKILVICFDSS
jgi:hypothetical protein